VDFSQTVTWRDQTETLVRAREITGIEYLRAMRDGSLAAPPIAYLLHLEFHEIESGHVVFSGLADRFFGNPMGTVHGGFAASLLDSALGCATLSLCKAGEGFTTHELQVKFVRPIPFETRVRCTGEVIHAGRRIVTSHGQIESEDGKLYAHGSSSCLLVPNEP